MNNRIVFYCMVGLTVLLVAASGGVMYAGNVILSHKSDQLVSLKLQNNSLELQQTTLLNAQKELKQYKELGNDVKAIVPQDKDQAQAVREIVKIAHQSGISLATITFPSSDLGSKTPAATSVTGKPVATPLSISQATPVKDIPGVYSLQMNVQPIQSATYTYNQIIGFLQRLETNRRTAQVNEINIIPDTQNISRLHFSLQLTIYIKP